MSASGEEKPCVGLYARVDAVDGEGCLARLNERNVKVPQDAKLAIEGNLPTVPKNYIRNWPIVDKNDRNAVLRVFDRGIFSGFSAPETTALQNEWSEYLGRKDCLATNSGTSALHMALAALGVGPGDEVITSAFTFLASASCALHNNAIPVFVDIDPRTYNIDHKKIEEKITDRTKAIIPVHIAGLPADMNEIMEIAKKHGLKIIEDACQAHGAKYKSRKIGTFGDIACFSLNSSKNLPGGEGGLFVTDDEYLRARGQMVRMFGEEVDDETRLRKYNASILGYMYRTQELPAAFARSQLRKLDANNSKRIENCNFLTQHLEEIEGVIPPYVPKDRTHVYCMYMVRFDPKKADVDLSPREFRIAVEKALYCEGVPVGQWQTMPVPAQDLFQTQAGYGGKKCPWNCKYYDGKVRYRAEDYPEALKLCEDYTTIAGIHPPNGLDLMEMYVKAFKKVFSNLEKVITYAKANTSPHYSGLLYGEVPKVAFLEEK